MLHKIRLAVMRVLSSRNVCLSLTDICNNVKHIITANNDITWRQQSSELSFLEYNKHFSNTESTPDMFHRNLHETSDIFMLYVDFYLLLYYYIYFYYTDFNLCSKTSYPRQYLSDS